MSKKRRQESPISDQAKEIEFIEIDKFEIE